MRETSSFIWKVECDDGSCWIKYFNFIGEVGLCWEAVEEVGVGLGVSGLTARVCICRRAVSYGLFCLSLFCDESDHLFCVASCVENLSLVLLGIK